MTLNNKSKMIESACRIYADAEEKLRESREYYKQARSTLEALGINAIGNELEEIVEKTEIVLNPNKILTVSVTEYCKNQGKSLNQYDLVGFRTFGNNLTASVQESIPPKTEAVVDYKAIPLPQNNSFVITGTALIPNGQSNNDSPRFNGYAY